MDILIDAAEAWLGGQEGVPAVRARRSLGRERTGDAETVHALAHELAGEQCEDRSFAHSLMKTASVLNLLADLRLPQSEAVAERGVDFLIATLQAQPGLRPRSVPGRRRSLLRQRHGQPVHVTLVRGKPVSQDTVDHGRHAILKEHNGLRAGNALELEPGIDRL